MKNKYILGIALVAIMVLSVVAFVPGALAAPTKDVDPGTKLVYKLNIIGVPKEGGASFSPGAEAGNGRRIFIPLKTTNYVDPCTTTGGQNNPDTSMEPTKGVKIKVSEGPFDVVDGNAVTDKVAAFTMPAARYDVYVAAKGKPGGCLDLEAYTHSGPDLVFIGSIDVDRDSKGGKPKYININHLLYDSGGNAYYSAPYYDYFWQLYNNGLRHMEVRFYEAPAV